MRDSDAAIRILIVENHPLVREGLRLRLGSRTTWTICGETDSQRDALRIARETEPDIATVDLRLTDGDGLDLIRSLSILPHPPRSLVVSMGDEKLFGTRAIQAGARGYLQKQQAAEQLIPAIEMILSGRLFISHDTSSRLAWEVMTHSNTTRRHENESRTNLERTSNEPRTNLERISNEPRTTLERLSNESRTNLERISNAN